MRSTPNRVLPTIPWSALCHAIGHPISFHFLSWNFTVYLFSGIILGFLLLDTKIAIIAFFQILITFLGCVSVSILSGRTILWLIIAGIAMMSVAFSPTMGISAYLMGGLIGCNLIFTGNAAHKLTATYHPLHSLQILMDNAIAGLSLGWLIGWLMIGQSLS